MKEMGHRATLLRVSMAFHSPVMKVIHDELREYIAAISFHAPRIPVISNTTMMPYPSDPDEIKKILMAHLESTVHWMDNVRFLRSKFGVRLFVEVGPGDTLSNLIVDTLPESVSVPTCLPSAEALTCKTALARLFVCGHLQVENKSMVVSFSVPMISDPMILEPVSPIAPDGTSEGSEVMEKLIQIIMDATGYNRDEIQPDMDLRRDLSIRSSRFPIIIDAAERQFSITIELEELMDVRTVNDIARRISMISARQNGAVPKPTATAIEPDPVNPEIMASPEDEANLKRLVFNHATIATPASIPIKLNSDETVLILSPGKDDGLAENAGDIFRMDYGVGTSAMGFMRENHCPGQDGCDIRSDEGALRAADKITGLASLSGMVISLGQKGAGRLESMGDVSRLLRGFFILLKAFLQSPAKKFVVLIHSGEDAGTHVRLLAEGMLGLFLSAAHEHASVQFRTLEIEKNTDLRKALRNGLDRGCAVVEMIHRNGKMITSEGNLAPSAFGDSSSLNLGPGDVVVMSGGATGISAHLARALVPFAPRLIFLGRTALDPDADFQESRFKHLSPGSFPSQSRASEIKKTLMDLHASGIDVTYHTCDVTDPVAVRVVMAETASRYGRIDGIIHGAGVLRDGFLSQMTPDDFSMVTDVKLLGAWNLFSSAKEAGLRFFIGLSSVAAVQGNPGQTNYAAANRMMAALSGALRGEKGDVLFKALMLPPVAGIGMADDSEIQALMKQKGVAYIHANELAGLFCRELFIAPADDDRVMFMKRLPTLKTALLNDRTGPSSNGRLDGGIVSFSPEDFPMIEQVSFIDIHREELEAARSFSLEKDLWITDHRPFKFIKHPIVSAAMVIETFMEAARILYPYLNVRGVQNIGLIDMIQCRPEIPRRSKIICRRSGNGHQKVVCALSLAAQEVSPAGRLTDRFTPKCKGEVILDGGNGGEEYIGEGFQDFPVRSEELQTRSMNQKKVLKWYKNHGGLTGRYRVIEGIDGAGPGEIRGRTRYSETSDFANLQNTRYQYSPYLFEALLQLVGFHTAATDPFERRSAVPMEIGEMKFSRKCLPGERITLEARMRARDSKGLTWDARGHDDQGRTLMQIRGLRMQLVSG